MAFLQSLKEAAIGTPGGIQQIPLYTPEQQQAYSQILGLGLGGLQDPTKGFEPIESRARQQFQQQTIPSIAERFTSLGGGQRSSAFGQQLGAAGSDLESQLAAMKAGYGLQRERSLLDLLHIGLQPQFGLHEVAGTSGFLSPLLSTAGSAIGGGIPGLIGGAISGIGGLLGRLFGGGSQQPASQALQLAQQRAPLRLSPDQINRLVQVLRGF